MATSRVLQIDPTNSTTSGIYSFRSGQAQVNFDIPQGNYLLDPTSVRLEGGIKFYKNATDTPNQNNSELLSINSRLGVYSVIQQLILKSTKNQSNLEHIRHYNRWMSSYMSLASSPQDHLSHYSMSSLTGNNFNETKIGVVDNNVPQDFCIHLPCGMFNSLRQGIPLTQNTLGGLSLTLMLENDQQALQVLPADNSTPPVITNFTQAHYELSGLRLVCRVLTPPIDQLSKLMNMKQGVFNIQTINSYYDTAQSSNIQLALNLQLSKVKSLYMNFIKSSNLNNLGQDGFTTGFMSKDDGSIVDIKSVQAFKGGLSFPKHFPNDTNFSKSSNVVLPDPEISKDYINSVVDYNKTRTGFMSGDTAGRNVSFIANDEGTAYQLVQDGGIVYGLGFNFENYIGGSGINLKGEQFGLHLDTTNDDGSAQSIFLFVNAETTIMYNENGIQVVN
jgi:hypothetical protein